jgi:ATP-dependent Lon protease
MEREKLVSLPVLPTKNLVLFPHLQVPVSVGRKLSLAAVEAALASEDKAIFLVTQRDNAVEEPRLDDLHTVGTRALIRNSTRAPDGSFRLMVQGVERAALVRLDSAQSEKGHAYLRGAIRALPVGDGQSTTEVEALDLELRELMRKIIALTSTEVSSDVDQLIASDAEPLHKAYLFASMVALDTAKEQALLEAPTVLDTLRLLHSYLGHEVKVLELRSEIASRVSSKLKREQRDYILRQQLHAIQEELGEDGGEGGGGEIANLRKRIEEAGLPPEVLRELERELARMKSMPPAAPDYNVTRNYLEFVLELPWNKLTEDVFDIAKARQILDEDHHGLREVKQRILEQLGVLKLNPGAKAPILCFVGPPGVGKTSLGRSIARSLGRKFERLSLGGLHDEAELRGHRRTYVGALPGRVLQAVRRAGSRNPVLMLDEIDKLGRDFRGDPAAALLEILDPEQNREFRDNYLDMPFDLSGVFFIATANTLDTVPAPLLDRLEVIELSGYTDREKLEIAKLFLAPKQMRETGLGDGRCSIDDDALLTIIRRYTRESGVRQLERAIAKLLRKVALESLEGGPASLRIGAADVASRLGPEKFLSEKLRRELPPGVAAGLAWTPVGGDVLYIEATLLPDGKDLTLTGQLGSVMQESARAARSFLWAHARRFGLASESFKDSGVHVHVPAGATPKDGPSAGITMAAAMASLHSGLPVRGDTAMTGEVTLSGLVLPVGGIREKVLAAHRAGIRRVILPRENLKDTVELPDYVHEAIEFVFVDRVEEVLAAAIEGFSARPVLGKAS